MNPRRLFVAGCIALITSAFSFMIRANISDPLGEAFSLTKEQVGEVMGAAFLGMAFSMLVFAPLCDILGMGTVLFLAWLCHLSGILGTIFAADITGQGFVQSALGALNFAFGNTPISYRVLFISTFLVGSGNGLVEIAINPLAATLFPREKTHYLNVLHAWWPGGLILSGLLATFATYAADPERKWIPEEVYGFKLWQVKMGFLLVPLAIYGLLCLGQRFPKTERVAANVSTGQMFLQALRPMFLLWAFCMLLTASSELGPNQWQESVLKRTAGVSGTVVLVYTSGLMFVMRFFAGPLAHRFSPVGLLMIASVLTAGGLYWLSYVDNKYVAFAAATVFGVGIAYYWPTMLGVTAERFPKGGALLLGLMGCVGNLAISQALPIMGGIYDSYSVKALPPALQSEKVVVNDKPVDLVTTGDKSWLERFVIPPTVADRIFPAGQRKLNPEAVKAVSEKAKAGDAAAEQIKQGVGEAEKSGAAWAFRWVSVLPCALIVIFGLIALIDKLRGGYKAVHIGGPEPAVPPAPEKRPVLTHSDFSRE